MLKQVARGYEMAFAAIQTVRSSETIQKTIDSTYFVLGFVGIHNLTKGYSFEDREVKEYEDSPFWQHKIWKTVDLMGDISLILAGLKSRPTIAIWRWSAEKITGAQQIERFLNQSSYLSGNNIYKTLGALSLLLGIPASLKTLYFVYSWICHSPSKQIEEKDEHHFTPIPVRKSDVAITVKTVSQTALKFIKVTPHK